LGHVLRSGILHGKLALYIQIDNETDMYLNTQPETRRSLSTLIGKANTDIHSRYTNTSSTPRYFLIRSELDFSWAKACLQACDDHHGYQCSPSANLEENSIIYFIDVEEHCLVKARSKSYVALSYIWGDVSGGIEHPKCCINSLPLMLQKGYFSTNSERSPLSIRNAITFCKKMGQRYLWIDRYCIVQDLLEQKQEQLKVMGLIYHNAYFTIIAAEGDAMTGLPGILTHFENDRSPESQNFEPQEHAQKRAINFVRCEEVGLTFSAQYDTIVQNTRWYSRKLMLYR
jgi:hypothetical protein